ESRDLRNPRKSGGGASGGGTAVAETGANRSGRQDGGGTSKPGGPECDRRKISSSSGAAGDAWHGRRGHHSRSRIRRAQPRTGRARDSPPRLGHMARG